MILNWVVNQLKEVELPLKIPTPKTTIKVAVTGLARSGKSVFLTSLINQLIANDKLNFLHDKLDRKFVARLLPPDSVYTRFDYYSKLKAFRAKDPKWPKATKSITKTTLELEFRSRYSLLENQKIDLELIDYPGEWLLDLEMLNLTYEQWSAKMIDLANQRQRVSDAKEFLQTLTDIKKGSNIDDEILHDIYSEYLKALSYKNFFYLQPGRFLEPSDMNNDPMLIFAPLPIELKRETLYKRFKSRYNQYVKEVVKRLYLEHFNSFDTQIVLIDLIRALENGYDSFEDIHLSLKNILKGFSYGPNSFISKFFNIKIDNVIFVATKADYFPNSMHNSYKNLLSSMIQDIKQDLDINHIKTQVDIISAVKSTQSVKAKIDNKTLDCVRGIVEGEFEPSTHFVGVLPDQYDDREFWQKANFKFPKFKPISFPLRDTSSVEHIRMDRLIYSILKDKV